MKLPDTVERDEVDDLDDPPSVVCYFIVFGNHKKYFDLNPKTHVLSVRIYRTQCCVNTVLRNLKINLCIVNHERKDFNVPFPLKTISKFFSIFYFIFSYQ